MKIGIISDTHDNIPLIDKALALFKEKGVEVVIHAGDIVAPFAAKALRAFSGPLYAVYGNNDGEREGLARVLDIVPPPREIVLAGKRIVVAHTPSEVPRWMQASADVLIVGHTHEVVMPEGGKAKPLVVNAGEGGGWLTGKATCAVLELDTMKAELCELS